MADSDPNLYAALVGKNAGFYLPYFRRCLDRGEALLSWNWSVFFLGLFGFGIFWFLYRRLYRWALQLLIVTILIAVLGAQLTIATTPEVGFATQTALNFAVYCIYAPLNANGIYFRWAHARIAHIRSEFPFTKERQMEQLAGRAPSVGIVLIVFALITFLTLMIVVSTMPLPSQ